MVADPTRRLIEAFGVGWPLLGLARRVTFVVDGAGTVRGRVVSELMVRRHVDQALSLVEPLAGGAPPAEVRGGAP
jgi:alkyl hydroperoxide reductase subunit AhpC